MDSLEPAEMAIQIMIYNLDMMQERSAYCEPMAEMPPPMIAPPCTKGPSLPAINPAAMLNTTPASLATNVRTCTKCQQAFVLEICFRTQIEGIAHTNKLG